jgi:hypothetical protein
MERIVKASMYELSQNIFTGKKTDIACIADCVPAGQCHLYQFIKLRHKKDFTQRRSMVF